MAMLLGQQRLRRMRHGSCLAPLCGGANDASYVDLATCTIRIAMRALWRKVTASPGCRNVLVVTGSAAKEVSEFIVLSAEPVGRLMLLEAAHTSNSAP